MDTGKHNFCEICFKLSKKTEKLLNEQPTHAIAKCSLTGLVQKLRSLIGSEIWSHACVFSTTCASWNSNMALPPAKKPKALACIKEIQLKYTNSGLRFTPKRGWQLCHMHTWGKSQRHLGAEPINTFKQSHLALCLIVIHNSTGSQWRFQRRHEGLSSSSTGPDYI